MQTKPVIFVFALLIWVAAALLIGNSRAYSQDSQKTSPPITIVLFDSSASYDDAVPGCVVTTRDALRKNSRLEVMLFSPSSPSFMLAAKSATPPIDLDDVSSASDEQAMTSAIGGTFYVVLSPDGGNDEVSAQIVDVSSGSTLALAGSESSAAAAADIASKIIAAKAADAVTVSPPTVPVPSPVIVATATTTPPTTASAPPVAVSAPIVDSPQPVLSPVAQAVVTVPTSVSPPTSSDKIQAVVSTPISSPPPASLTEPTSSVPIVSSPTAVAARVQTTTASSQDSSDDVMPDPASMPVETPSAVAPVALPGAGDQQSTIGAPEPGSVLDDQAKNAIAQGDGAMQSNDALSAIEAYKNAISLSPRVIEPRLRLAQAYLQAGMKDEALDEAKRALALDPTNADVKSFIDAQADGGSASDDVVIAEAQTESDPDNPAGWIALGDAYWNVNDPDDSLISYKRAADINPTAVLPQTRLAKLYAARAQYDESLIALRKSGPEGYPYALRIISSRSESLVGDMDDETDSFLKGTETREQFYAKLKNTDSQAEGLADFVAKIVPPGQYSVSHLHRRLSTTLLAQTVSIWIDFAETNNTNDKSQANTLEQHAIDEMKTASVAEDLQEQVNP